MSKSEEHHRSYRDRYQRKSDKDERSTNSRFRPVVENLILFVMNRSKWFRTVREFVENELKIRGGLVLKGIIFLSMGIGLILMSLTLLLVILILALEMIIGNLLLATLTVFLIALLSAILLIILTVRSFGKAVDMSNLEEKSRSDYKR